MNSAEQKDFEHVTPSNEEIRETISFISKKLDVPEMGLLENEPFKEGYSAAIKVLTNDIRTYEMLSQNLTTLGGKAIAILAVNYLNGECSQKTLLAFGIKKEY